MGSWRRMGAFLGLVAQDGDERDDYAYANGEYDAPYSAPYATSYSGGVRDNDSRGSGLAEAEPLTHGALAMQPLEQERRSSADSGTGSRPITVKLTGFTEARVIGERYREGASVILDMTDLTDGDARRVVDFAAGLAFALHGSIDKVTSRVFMLLPPHADMSAAERRAVAAGSFRRG